MRGEVLTEAKVSAPEKKQNALSFTTGNTLMLLSPVPRDGKRDLGTLGGVYSVAPEISTIRGRS